MTSGTESFEKSGSFVFNALAAAGKNIPGVLEVVRYVQQTRKDAGLQMEEKTRQRQEVMAASANAED
jgi:hypothetical protein